ncbi:hypothetical protein SAMN05216564_12011 [Halopenitus persicus]|uniref:Uncharacterized protein n=1 Tax=Halopenitus persicus TaxID=1048396 RepID=A0A1H3P6D9_9EURY|nr:hypothetical protein SAMN05216564_12011 [Halopenitus persicus]
MNNAVSRRLNVLIVLCSALLGIVLTYLVLSPQAGFGFFLFVLVPTLVITVLAFSYVEKSSAAETDEETHI